MLLRRRQRCKRLALRLRVHGFVGPAIGKVLAHDALKPA